MSKNQIYEIVVAIATAIVTITAVVLGFSSCNVTRTITTSATSYTSGDTTRTITTKTVEMYDASKKLY